MMMLTMVTTKVDFSVVFVNVLFVTIFFFQKLVVYLSLNLKTSN